MNQLLLMIPGVIVGLGATFYVLYGGNKKVDEEDKSFKSNESAPDEIRLGGKKSKRHKHSVKRKSRMRKKYNKS
jgi:hypothetical protein